MQFCSHSNCNAGLIYSFNPITHENKSELTLTYDLYDTVDQYIMELDVRLIWQRPWAQTYFVADLNDGIQLKEINYGICSTTHWYTKSGVILTIMGISDRNNTMKIEKEEMKGNGNEKEI